MTYVASMQPLLLSPTLLQGCLCCPDREVLRAGADGETWRCIDGVAVHGKGHVHHAVHRHHQTGARLPAVVLCGMLTNGFCAPSHCLLRAKLQSNLAEIFIW